VGLELINSRVVAPNCVIHKYKVRVGLVIIPLFY
jgi:hypothetical protein